MVWEIAGQRVDAITEHQERAQKFLSEGTDSFIEINDKPYLIRGGYYVPYFSPHSEEDDVITRERLNLELCQRIIRESEIRHVSRNPEEADAELKRSMQAFEVEQFECGRGKAVVLFQNIVNRMRELSQEYLECAERAKILNKPTLQAEDIQNHIKELYEYVMVKQQGIMDVIRRADGTRDKDGAIREMFSEIGKPYKVPLSLIYENRVTKIAKAMHGMDEVSQKIILALTTATQTPKSQAIHHVSSYVTMAKKLCGLPSHDHQVFNETSEGVINALDATHKCLKDMDYIGLEVEKRLLFTRFVKRGLALIDDMQKLRDERKYSIETYCAEADVWIKA